MQKIIGHTVNEIAGLKITNGNREDDEIVLIRGYLSEKNPDKSFSELVELGRDYDTEQLALDVFNKQKNLILNGGYGRGKKLEITTNAIYDIIVRAVGFNYRQLVRDLFVDLRGKIEDEKEIVVMEKRLQKAIDRGLTDLIKELQEDIEDARDLLGDVSVIVPKNTGNPSERSTINQISKQCRIPVKVHDTGNEYLVVYRPDSTKHVKATAGRGGMMTWNINQWLATLPPLTPTKPPSEIVTGCTDSYFRTVINKSPYYCSYRRGLVTIYPACIKDGHVYLGTKPLAPAVGVCSAEYLDMVLIPHGYDHTSVMGWSRSVSQGGSGSVSVAGGSI